MSKVLLVDAAFSAEPLYRALKGQGHELITVGSRGQDTLAKTNNNHRLLDYSNIELLKVLVKEEKIDFVVPGCTDRSYASCVAINNENRYPGLDSEESFSILHDKQKFRQFTEKEGLSVPKIFTKDRALNQENIIVKPVDSFSGKGITLLCNPNRKKLQQAWDYAIKKSASGKVIIESYAKGRLYSHSAFLANKRIIQDYWVEEYGAVNPFSVDVSYITQKLPDFIRKSIRDQIEHLAQTLNLCDGLLHTQFIYDGKNFSLIETTRRCPGDLYSQLIQLGSEYDYAKSYVAGFLGKNIEPVKKQKINHILRHTVFCPPHATFYGIKSSIKAPMCSFVPLMLSGDKSQDSYQRVGIAFYKCSSLKALSSLKNNLLKTPF